MMMEFNRQIIFFIAYLILLLAAIDYRNFGFRSPFLFNFTLNLTVGVTNLLSIFAFAIHHNTDKGLPPIILPLGLSAVIFILMFFNRHKYGYVFVLAAFAVGIYGVESIYDVVDNKNYSFQNDFDKFYKPVCGEYLSKLTATLERAKQEMPPDDPMAKKKFDYMIFDESSEIYLYLKNKYNYEYRYKFDRKLAMKLPLSKYIGVYKIKNEKHNFYTTAGMFKDVVIYCDDVAEAEVKTALDKAKADYNKLHGSECKIDNAVQPENAATAETGLK